MVDCLRMKRRTWLTISVLAAAWAITIGILQWLKLRDFGYNGLDLAIYTNTTWSLSHGHGFASSIHDPSYLGDHVEVWLYPVSWIFRLWPSALTLLFVQTLVLASAIIPLAKLAGQYFRDRGGLIAAVIFVVHPLVINSALYEFHGLVFVLPILLWSIVWYRQRRWGWWVASLIGLVLVREDLPLLAAGWGLLALVDRRSWRWWAAPFLISASWYLVAQQIIAAYAQAGTYKYLAFYRWLGETPGEMVSFLFRHPLIFLRQIASLNNWQTAGGLLVGYGFLPLLGWRKLWPLVLVICQMLLLRAEPISFLRLHYVLPYLPFLAWATLSGLRRFRDGQVFGRLDPLIRQAIITVLLIVGVLFSHLTFGPWRWPWHAESTYVSDSSVLRQALTYVQPTDRVLTTFNLLPSLANRATIYSLNYLFLGRRQYSELPYHLPSDIDVAVIDWQQLYDYQFFYRTTYFNGQSGTERIFQLLKQQGLYAVFFDGSVAVYRREGSMPQTLYSQRQTLPAATGTMLGPVELLRANVMLAPESPVGRRVLVEQSWVAHQTAIDHVITAEYQFRQAGRVVSTIRRVLGQGTQPASDWRPNEDWRTFDWLPAPSVTGDVSVHLRLLSLSGREVMNSWATFRPVVDATTVLGEASLGTVRL